MDERSTRDEELDDLMRRASAIYNNMSLDERRKHDRAQRISWVYGEMRLIGHDVTHEQVEAMLVKTGALSAAPIRVTVDGEPVTREVTLDQVREYLRAKGWEKRDETRHIEVWARNGSPDGPFVDLLLTRADRDREHALTWAIGQIATHEDRHPAAVLRDIAGEPIGDLWTWTGVAGSIAVRATVGVHALFVERADGAEMTPEVHRAALAEALGAAGSTIREAVDREGRMAADLERLDEIAEAWKALAQARSKRGIPMIEGVGEELARRAAMEREATAKLRALGIDPDAP